MSESELEKIPSMNDIFKNNNTINLLLDLSMMKKTPVTVTDIEKELNFKNPQPWLRDVIKLLIRLDIIKEKERIFHVTRYKIDKKKLTDMIDELELTNKWFKYFETYHLVEW